MLPHKLPAKSIEVPNQWQVLLSNRTTGARRVLTHPDRDLLRRSKQVNASASSRSKKARLRRTRGAEVCEAIYSQCTRLTSPEGDAPGVSAPNVEMRNTRPSRLAAPAVPTIFASLIATDPSSSTGKSGRARAATASAAQFDACRSENASS